MTAQSFQGHSGPPQADYPVIKDRQVFATPRHALGDSRIAPTVRLAGGRWRVFISQQSGGGAFVPNKGGTWVRIGLILR